MTNNETKLKVLEQIKALKILTTVNSVEDAINWSNKNLETKPHFIIKKDNSHVLIY